MSEDIKSRHCARVIALASGERKSHPLFGGKVMDEWWEDADGFMTCVKGRGIGYIGVLHQPMPDGLRGSATGERSTE